MKKFVCFIGLILALAVGLQIYRAPFAQSPQNSGDIRIVSLAPSITETLFALGMGPHVVGVTTYCNFPPETDHIDKVGNFLSPNFEKLVSLKPTLVLSEIWPSSKTVTRLRELGLPVTEVVSPASIAEIFAFTLEIGRAVNQFPQAEALVSQMKKKIARIEQRQNEFSSHPSVYVEIDLPSWTVGKPSFITEALTLCGGQNIFADVNFKAIQASLETIVHRNPEVILSFDASAQEIRHRAGWQSIRAVEKRQIIDDIDRDLLSRGNYRLLEGMEMLQERLWAYSSHE